MKDDNKSTSKCKEIVNSIAFHLAEASGAASDTFCPTPLTFQNAAHGVEHLQGEPSAALAQGVLCRWRHASSRDGGAANPSDGRWNAGAFSQRMHIRPPLGWRSR